MPTSPRRTATPPEPGSGLRELRSDQRRELFQRLLAEVVLPQRRRLLQYRDHTWQSAHVDSDGYLGELIAAIVTGEPGRSRRGKGAGAYDLADGTEVKSSYRIDPNIDFVFEGTVRDTRRGGRRERVIEVHSAPEELTRDEIICQINANASSVQLLAANDPSTYPVSAELGRTTSKDALVDDGGLRVRLTRGANFVDRPDGSRVVACVRQERAHINFGDRSRADLDATFARPPVLVFYTFDRMGRPLFVVTRVGLTDGERAAYLDRIYGAATGSRQVQPYLFPDNVRDRLYRSDKHAVVDALRGRLLAVAVGAPSGVEVLHWEPDDPPLVADNVPVLTSIAHPEQSTPFSHDRLDLDLASEAGRKRALGDFYATCVKEWYAGISEFCDLAGVTRNMGLGNLAQHLVSLRTGLRGSRSGARGPDLVERDDSISEIKLATGDPNEINNMRSTDRPRLNLQSNLTKMLTWRRLFPVRIVETSDGIHAVVHAPTEATMHEFRVQIADYFRQRGTSPNLQYHAMDPFPHDRYGVQGRHLVFERVAWMKPSGAHEFAGVPEW